MTPFLQSPAAWWLASVLFALCILVLALIAWQAARHTAVLSEREARENTAPRGSVNYIYDREVAR